MLSYEHVRGGWTKGYKRRGVQKTYDNILTGNEMGSYGKSGKASETHLLKRSSSRATHGHISDDRHNETIF